MTCDEVREHLELHLLDLLAEPERADVASHLAEGCPVCKAALEKARELNWMVMTSVDAVQPPSRLRRRVLAALTGGASTSQIWLSWSGYAIAASLALLLIWQGTRVARQERQLTQAKTALEQAGLARQELKETIDFLRDPVTQVTSTGGGPAGVYYLNARRGVLLIASNLAPLDTSKTYQMWVIPKGQSPMPAGLFQPRPDGSAIHRFATSFDLRATAAVAVTVEPAAGSAAPTTQPFLVAPVGP